MPDSYRLPCNYCGNKQIITLMDADYNVTHAHCTVCGADGPKKSGYSFNDRIDALPPDQIVLTERWGSEICNRLDNLERGYERHYQGFQNDRRCITRNLGEIYKFLEKIQHLHGDTNGRMVYIIKLIKKLLNIS